MNVTLQLQMRLTQFAIFLNDVGYEYAQLTKGYFLLKTTVFPQNSQRSLQTGTPDL